MKGEVREVGILLAEDNNDIPIVALEANELQCAKGATFELIYDIFDK